MDKINHTMYKKKFIFNKNWRVIESLIKECKILEALEHTNIIRFIEYYINRFGRLCIVMEYADGIYTQ